MVFDFDAGELPHSTPPGSGFDLSDSKFAIAIGNPGQLVKNDRIGTLLFGRKLFNFPSLPCHAPNFDGTLFALRVLGCTNGGTKFHQCLIPVAGLIANESFFRPGEGFFVKGASSFGVCGDAGKNALDIAVDKGGWIGKGNTGDRTCGVFADAGNLSPSFGSSGVAVLGNPLGTFDEELATPIIAKALPRGEGGGFVSFGKRLRGWKLVEPALVVGQHGSDLGLLKHNFAYPNRPGVRFAPPREVSPVFEIPV